MTKWVKFVDMAKESSFLNCWLLPSHRNCIWDALGRGRLNDTKASNSAITHCIVGTAVRPIRCWAMQINLHVGSIKLTQHTKGGQKSCSVRSIQNLKRTVNTSSIISSWKHVVSCYWTLDEWKAINISAALNQQTEFSLSFFCSTANCDCSERLYIISELLTLHKSYGRRR